MGAHRTDPLITIKMHGRLVRAAVLSLGVVKAMKLCAPLALSERHGHGGNFSAVSHQQRLLANCSPSVKIW